MEEIKKKEESEIEKFKQTNEEYINEITRFLDVVSNIKDEELQEVIIFQMLRCDKILTEMTENLCKKYKDNKV